MISSSGMVAFSSSLLYDVDNMRCSARALLLCEIRRRWYQSKLAHDATVKRPVGCAVERVDVDSKWALCAPVRK